MTDAKGALVRAYKRFQRVPCGNELVGLALLVLVMQFFPGGMPLSVLVGGTSGAAPLVLNAIGLVLVFRANRFLNLAQLQIGIFGATLFTGLVQGQLLLHTLHHVCSGCVAAFPDPTAQAINFWIAAVTGLAASALLSVLLYALVLRRFAKSPVLVPTIVTVFIAEALNGFQATMTKKLVHLNDVRSGRALETITSPIHATVTISGYPLSFPTMLLSALAVVALVAIVVYLRRSRTGVAIRAAADNPGRAATLGVNVASVTSRIWLIVGILSGLAAIVPAFIGGVGAATLSRGPSASIPIEQIVVLLTVLVFARFTNLWMAALSAVVLSTLSVAVQVAYSSQTPLDAAYVFIVGGLLLLQRDTSTRANREDFSGLDLTQELRPIPRELRRLPNVVNAVRWGAIVGAVLLLALPFTISIGQTSLLIDSITFAIVGLSVLVLTGWAGQVSLGQFGFASIGAWAAACSHAPFPIAVLIGGLTGAVAALIVGLPALKLRGVNLAISSMAFSVSAQALFIDNRYFGRLLPASLSLPNVLGVNFGDQRVLYYTTLVVVLLFIGVIIGLRRSRTGRVLIAIRANEATAQSFGINVLRARLTAFCVSGFMAAVAGALLAYHLGSVAPQTFIPEMSLVIFLYAVLGGLGGLAGPLMGLALYAMITFFFNGNPLVQSVGGGLGAVLLMLFAPGGVAQLVYGVRDAALRRLAMRLRIPVPSLMGDRGATMAADRVALDEPRHTARRAGEALPIDYQPPGQWALERLGTVDGKQERVGVR